MTVTFLLSSESRHDPPHRSLTTGTACGVQDDAIGTEILGLTNLLSSFPSIKTKRERRRKKEKKKRKKKLQPLPLLNPPFPPFDCSDPLAPSAVV